MYKLHSLILLLFLMLLPVQIEKRSAAGLVDPFANGDFSAAGFSGPDRTVASATFLSRVEDTYLPGVILQSDVENYLEYFLTDGREGFQEWLNRSVSYVPLMKDVFRKYGLPEELVYLAMIESGFDPFAVSPARAVGPWQFMPSTAERYGLRTDPWVDERRDPVKSTHAAARHLKDLYALFGSWPLALSSYNAGAGRVQRAVLCTTSEGFSSLSGSRVLRKETRDYVPKFMAAVIIVMNIAHYGFRLPPEEPFAYDEVAVPAKTDLRDVARFIGGTVEQLQDLNPEMNRFITPPVPSGYVLRLPPGTRQLYRVRRALAEEGRADRGLRVAFPEPAGGGRSVASLQYADEPGWALARRTPLANRVAGMMYEITALPGEGADTVQVQGGQQQ